MQWNALLAAAASTLLALPAAAQDAIVEEAGPTLSVARLDYLKAGNRIELGADGRLVLAYLRSCWRETIVGGFVTIGHELSEVFGGQVNRARTTCSAGALRLRPGEGQQSAVMVFRAPAAGPDDAGRSPAGTVLIHNILFGTSPLIEIPGGAKVHIERVDSVGEYYEIIVPRGSTMAQSRYDMALMGQTLTPGGIYRVRYGSHAILFGVHDSAQGGASPIVGRLLRLPPM